jgi:hypothetical protein
MRHERVNTLDRFRLPVIAMVVRTSTSSFIFFLRSGGVARLNGYVESGRGAGA